MPDLRYIALAALSVLIATILFVEGALFHAACAWFAGALYIDIGCRPHKSDG